MPKWNDIEDVGTDAVFTDTSVLFDYAIDEEPEAQELFLDHPSVAKVTSQRGRTEFKSVMARREDIHRSLRTYVATGDLDDFDPDGLDNLSNNDWQYLIELYQILRETESDDEAVRRLNEEKRKLKTAWYDLFENSNSFVSTIDVDPIDIRLRDNLSIEIDNMDDVRILCDVVEWAREDGTGTFLTTDYGDFMERTDLSNEGQTPEDAENEESTEMEEIANSLDEFIEGDERTKLERINDQIQARYSESVRVVILDTEMFLSHLD